MARTVPCTQGGGLRPRKATHLQPPGFYFSLSNFISLSKNFHRMENAWPCAVLSVPSASIGLIHTQDSHDFFLNAQSSRDAAPGVAR